MHRRAAPFLLQFPGQAVAESLRTLVANGQRLGPSTFILSYYSWSAYALSTPFAVMLRKCSFWSWLGCRRLEVTCGGLSWTMPTIWSSGMCVTTRLGTSAHLCCGTCWTQSWANGKHCRKNSRGSSSSTL